MAMSWICLSQIKLCYVLKKTQNIITVVFHAQFKTPIIGLHILYNAIVWIKSLTFIPLISLRKLTWAVL